MMGRGKEVREQRHAIRSFKRAQVQLGSCDGCPDANVSSPKKITIVIAILHTTQVRIQVLSTK
jgi:hypothetical protein